MSNEIKGKIIIINDIETFESGFMKRTFVIDTGGEYPQQIPLSFVKDKCGVLDGYKVNQEVAVNYNLNGNEHNGKYYVNLTAWKISLNGASHDPPVEKAENKEQDDIPF